MKWIKAIGFLVIWVTFIAPFGSDILYELLSNPSPNIEGIDVGDAYFVAFFQASFYAIGMLPLLRLWNQPKKKTPKKEKIPSKSSSLAVDGSLDTEEAGVFLEAKNELENGTKDEGIWTMAYSNTANEEEAKKLYIRLRVDQIYEDSELSSLDPVKKNSPFGIWGRLLLWIIIAVGLAAAFNPTT